MKIGILSDSHGRTRRLRAAVSALQERGATVIVHCGDVTDTKALHILADTGAEVYVVAGNMDKKLSALETAAAACGVHFASEVIEVPLGNGRFLVATHGHDEKVLGELIADEQFPYVCCGHTHCPADQRHGKTRVINPGALCHPHRPFPPTAAVLDTETDTLECFEVDA